MDRVHVGPSCKLDSPCGSLLGPPCCRRVACCAIAVVAIEHREPAPALLVEAAPVAVVRPEVVDRFDLAQAEIDALRARANTAESRLATALALPPASTAHAPRCVAHRRHDHGAPAPADARVVQRVYSPIEVTPGSMLSLFA